MVMPSVSLPLSISSQASLSNGLTIVGKVPTIRLKLLIRTHPVSKLSIRTHMGCGLLVLKNSAGVAISVPGTPAAASNILM